MSKKIKILLGVSLALNLLFVGLVGGMVWKFKGFMHHDNKARFVAQKLIKDLPAERQKVLLSGFESLKMRSGDGKRVNQSKWSDVMKAVSSEPFNGVVVREALTNLHKTRWERKQKVGEKFIVMMENMTVKERNTVRNSCMFKKMQKRRGRYGKGH